MTALATEGFAVVYLGLIQPNSVRATRRAAMVNGLETMFSIPVSNACTDEEIESAWHNCTRAMTLGGPPEIINVSISEAT